MPSETSLTSDDLVAAVDHAKLLFQSGREEAGREAFDAVRPSLSQDPDASGYVGAALEECGLAAVAEEWLSQAARTLLDSGEFDPDDDAGTIEVVFGVLHERHRIREVLELEHDDLDGLFHEMEAAAEGPDLDGQALLYWPEAELAQVLERWPALAEIYGLDWLDHRTNVERTLAGWSAAGVIRIALLPGSMAGLLAFAAAEGEDPADQETHADYADEVIETAEPMEWPPQRNAPCWCASGLKYKKCCLPRSRA